MSYVLPRFVRAHISHKMEGSDLNVSYLSELRTCNICVKSMHLSLAYNIYVNKWKSMYKKNCSSPLGN
jgi:hypothetical protein